MYRISARAADLFHEAGKTLREADTYEALRQYRKAISALLAKKLVDEAICRLIEREAYSAASMVKGERETLVHRVTRVGVRQAQRLRRAAVQSSCCSFISEKAQTLTLRVC